MQQTIDHRKEWANRLDQLRLGGITAALLEGMGPLTILLAQLMYIGEPIFSWTLPEGQWVEFARMLENQEDVHTFAASLKEDRWN